MNNSESVHQLLDRIYRIRVNPRGQDNGKSSEIRETFYTFAHAIQRLPFHIDFDSVTTIVAYKKDDADADPVVVAVFDIRGVV